MAQTELVKKAMLAVQRFPWDQGVCGCQQGFTTEGTSAESMAAYLMMHAWKEKAEENRIL